MSGVGGPGGPPTAEREAGVAVTAPPALSPYRALLYRRPWLKVVLLLLPGLLWLGVLYLGSLGSLLVQSLYSLEEFTGLVVREVTLRTYASLSEPANLDIIIRTTVMALAVTVACGVIAFPIANYMARYASPR